MRVLQRTARKDYPNHGIKKGDTYYKWSFFRQRPRMSKTPPKPWELTQNENIAAVMQAYGEASYDADGVEAIASAVREAADGEQEKFDNLPEGFQQGDTGQQIEERATAYSEAADALDEIAEAIREEERHTELPHKPADEDAVDDVLEAWGISLEYHEVDYKTWTLTPNTEAISEAVSETEPST